MDGQKFIENRNACFFLRLKLTKLKEKSSLGNPLYRHKKTDMLWEKYAFDKNEAQRISGSAFRIYPYSSTQALIEIAVQSNDIEEYTGAARLLFQLEYTGVYFREALIKQLEEHESEIYPKKFNVIFTETNLGSKTNLIDPFKKPSTEVDKDYKYFSGLAERAELLKARICKTPT